MTNTALTTAAPDRAPVAKPSIEKGGALAALVPKDLDDAFRLAKALSSAGDMVPRHFQGKPEATMAAIVRGMEVGLAPMQALSQIAVINGRASIWGDAIPALLQRAGHHIDVEYEGAGDALVAVATLTRGDSGKTVVRRFGIADAKRAGLLGKQGPWQQYPQRMCAHRARTWAARDGAADALMGMQVAEEVSDYGPDRARDVTPAPRRGGVVYADPDEDEILEHQQDSPAREVEDAETVDDHSEILDRARTEARKGTESFRTFWNSDEGKEHRELLRTILEDCQKLAQDADAAAATNDDDPFGLPPIQDDGMTPEQRAELEAAEREFEGRRDEA